MLRLMSESIKIDAPQEGVLSLSGSLKINGAFYQLKGTAAELITDPDSGGTDYDHHVDADNGFSELINDAGSAYAKSNSFSVTSGDIIKVITFLTVNSGQVPSVAIFEVGGGAAAISNVEALVAGLNIVTLTCTDTHTACLNISNIRSSRSCAQSYLCIQIHSIMTRDIAIIKMPFRQKFFGKIITKRG